MIAEKVKGIGASLINAVLFIVAFTIFTSIVGVFVGEGFSDLQLDNLGVAFAEGDLTIGLLVAVFFIGTGSLVVFFGRMIRPRIAMLLKVEDQESSEGTDLSYSGKAIVVTILTFFIVGLLTIMFISAFNGFLGNIQEDVNIIGFETLVQSINNSSPEFWFWYIIGLLILATIVDVFGRYTQKISGGITDRIS